MQNSKNNTDSYVHQTENSEKFSNCHRTKYNTDNNADSKSKSPNDYQTDSDTDSSASKYVVREDNRERRDGPGGN